MSEARIPNLVVGLGITGVVATLTYMFATGQSETGAVGLTAFGQLIYFSAFTRGDEGFVIARAAGC